MRYRFWILFPILFVLGSVLGENASGKTDDGTDSLAPKLIELGWDIPDTGYIRDHYETMESTTPFDGILYEIAQSANGTKLSSQWLFDATPWNRDDFQACIEDLRSCTFEQFTENFIRVNFSPASVSWDDDSGWKILCAKVALCAWVAKESGCTRGLAPDFESYGATMFRWDPNSGRTFGEAQELARKRGREFIDAIRSEYPDAVILALWLNSINFSAGRSETPETILESGHYGLLPAFIDGMLSAAPPEMIFVDGCESGYYMDGNEAYQRASLEMIQWFGPAMRLIAPENRGKYRRQVRAGFGFYLDMYSNPEGSSYYRAAHEGETRYDRMCENLGAAIQASDGYVWVYGEKYRWWRSSESSGYSPEPESTLWQEIFPGISDRFWAIKNPSEASRRAVEEILRSGSAENLLKNPEFTESTSAGTRPANWGDWQHEDSHGTFGYEDARAVTRGVLDGCFIQSVDVNPGERYAVFLEGHTEGRGVFQLTVRWQTPDGRWTNEDRDQTFSVASESTKVTEPTSESQTTSIETTSTESSESPEPSRRITGYVQVPSDAGKLALLLMTRRQESPSDRIVFERSAVYRLP